MIGLFSPDKNWGVKPVLFEAGRLEIPSYGTFVMLGIIAGIFIYSREAKKDNIFTTNAFYIFVSAIIGGAIGAKIPFWIVNYKEIISRLPDITLLLSGRTILGGLIGGTTGVILTKKILKIKIRMGNQIAPAVAIGVAIGRIGCFLGGCCYGKPTGFPWGVDFGDGMLRHPTQIYELIFNVIMFIYLLSIKPGIKEQGKLFTIYLNSYFIFRFFNEFLRAEKTVFLGFTGFQLASFFALLYINRDFVSGYLKKRYSYE